MVWRQLPKLVPAGSIPVSCSTEKGRHQPPFFCGAGTERTTSAHRVRLIYLTCRGCRFAFEQRENLAPQAQIPVSCFLFYNEKNHIRTWSQTSGLPAADVGSRSSAARNAF